MRLTLAIYGATLAVLAGLAVIGGLLLWHATGPSNAAEEAADDHAYDFARWEVQNFPRKWVYKLHDLIFGGSVESDDAAIKRCFELTKEISALQQQDPPPDRLAEVRKERRALQPEVENILEGRMTSVLEDQDLALDPPLFSDLGLVFPPVDFKLDIPPRVLAVSPRNRIALEQQFALEPGLTPEDYAQIEQKAESENTGESGVAALVVGTSGVATYPSAVSADDSYAGMMETAFHEWLHQYLIFFPLGRSYFKSADLRTLNESVATLGGRELARAYFQRYGFPQETATQSQQQPSTQPAFDFTEQMRALRREVEAMLMDGKVTEAEQLMEQRRQEFASHGYFLRRLNQAYFAFNGSYAFSPGSVDPIGGKLQTLLQTTGSPGAFLRAVRGMTSRADVDEALPVPRP